MKSTLKAHHNKLKALFAQHSQSTVESKQPPDEPIAVGPEPTEPQPYDERALTEQVAKQVGWNVGDEVQAKVSNRQMVNKRYVWASVEGWSELVKISVHDRDAWPAGSTLWCQYVKADSEGCLVFNTRERGPKWKRRAA
jgi:hypothetical protein